jgi:uncharacterized protein YbaA (DUF1428 family)
LIIALDAFGKDVHCAPLHHAGVEIIAGWHSDVECCAAFRHWLIFPIGARSMARYVDGFVVPVPKRKLAAYQKMARTAGRVWREHGALQYVECAADDVSVGKVTSFPRSVKLKPGETVVFSYIVYKSRAARDRILGKVMQDPRFAKIMDPKKMPFDGKRMFWGGFKTLVML